MNNEFSKKSNLELYELEYSTQHAEKYGYHTATVNGKTVTYTNVSELNLAGERVDDPNDYAWPDKRTVGVCVGYLKEHKRNVTPEGQRIEESALETRRLVTDTALSVLSFR